MTRYVVQTVTGYTFTLGERGGGAKEGLSAHVCDSVELYRVVASYRSEASRRGNDYVLRKANEHAARLNDGC